VNPPIKRISPSVHFATSGEGVGLNSTGKEDDGNSISGDNDGLGIISGDDLVEIIGVKDRVNTSAEDDG